MAVIDLENLLQPLSEESPCGRNCEYEPAFGELERTVRGTPERSSNGSVHAAEPPVWSEVASQAQALFAETKDLRVAMALAHAALKIDGLAGLAAGQVLVHGLLENYWEQVYPLLDADDDNDPTLRMNALLALCDRQHLGSTGSKHQGFLDSLLRLPILSERQAGQFSLRDIKLASGALAPSDNEPTPDPALIDAAFTGTELQPLEAAAASIQQALASFSSITKLLDTKVGAQGANLTDFGKELEGLNKVFNAQLEQRGIASNDADAGSSAVDGAANPNPAAISGEIRSREDVIRALDRISDYFRQHEPSSPIPLLLDRAKRLVAKNFVEILQDLTPTGVDEALMIGGIQPGQDDGS